MENIFEDQTPPKLTSTLNVLTILTFIGCALQFISAFFAFTTAKSNYENREEVIQQMQSDEVPGFLKGMMGTPEEYTEIVTKSLENRIPILLISLLSVFLCFYGALQMRKLKKQGYTFYVVGQILPFISIIVFLGTSIAFSGGTLFSFVIALIFILLYTTQRKHLVY